MRQKIIGLLLIVAVFVAITWYTSTHLTSTQDDIQVHITPIDETLPQPSEGANIISSSGKGYVNFEREHVINIQPVLQLPDYPTGCEIVSLSMALSYVTKKNVSVDYLIDRFLPREENNFAIGFVGDPRREDGSGCFPPAIVTTANLFFDAHNIDLKAMDVTGSTLEDLIYYIDQGIPVVIWGTMNLATPSFAEYFAVYDNKPYYWYFPEHCLLLKGYDDEKNIFILNDPLQGEIECDIDVFFKIYETVGSMAVIIA